MRILKILTQHRRDFTATLICEHDGCGHQQELTGGYDDANYHENVIPIIKCDKCGEVATDDYQPNTSKYDAGTII
jgi:formylmethanofuran dehydrogenase subunit E